MGFCQGEKDKFMARARKRRKDGTDTDMDRAIRTLQRFIRAHTLQKPASLVMPGISRDMGETTFAFKSMYCASTLVFENIEDCK